MAGRPRIQQAQREFVGFLRQAHQDNGGRGRAEVAMRRGLSATSKSRAGHAPGSSVILGRLRGGEFAYLCWRDAKQLFEVSGELVGAGVAVHGDEVLDGG
jgi:hypothetical protein